MPQVIDPRPVLGARARVHAGALGDVVVDHVDEAGVGGALVVGAEEDLALARQLLHPLQRVAVEVLDPREEHPVRVGAVRESPAVLRHRLYHEGNDLVPHLRYATVQPPVGEVVDVAVEDDVHPRQVALAGPQRRRWRQGDARAVKVDPPGIFRELVAGLVPRLLQWARESPSHVPGVMLARLAPGRGEGSSTRQVGVHAEEPLVFHEAHAPSSPHARRLAAPLDVLPPLGRDHVPPLERQVVRLVTCRSLRLVPAQEEAPCARMG
mmetsp:Transcript_4583/g.10968  ORF Transcript_4583/g.10968 Transcript_4583/m.10968 type:complete len:266 (-) Transcript_4583:277-1074(-)